jgi:hypothetical protein
LKGMGENKAKTKTKLDSRCTFWRCPFRQCGQRWPSSWAFPCSWWQAMALRRSSSQTTQEEGGLTACKPGSSPASPTPPPNPRPVPFGPDPTQVSKTDIGLEVASLTSRIQLVTEISNYLWPRSQKLVWDLKTFVAKISKHWFEIFNHL